MVTGRDSPVSAAWSTSIWECVRLGGRAGRGRARAAAPRRGGRARGRAPLMTAIGRHGAARGQQHHAARHQQRGVHLDKLAVALDVRDGLEGGLMSAATASPALVVS